MFKLSEPDIQQFFGKTIYQRGRDYYQRGHVSNLMKNGQTVQARVKGSEYRPYNVTIQLKDMQVVNMHCNCLYDDDCKHCAATLLALLYDQNIQQCEPVETLLNTLDTTQLKQLLMKLAEHSAEFSMQIELFALQLQQPICEVNDDEISFSKVDFDLIRRRARHDAEVTTLLQEVEFLVQAKQHETALEVLKIVTEAQVNRWVDQFDDYENYEYEECEGEQNLYEITRLWAELMLSLPLQEEQKDEFQTLLEGWSSELYEYAPVDFALALGVLQYGWDFEPLQQALRGERQTPVFAEVETPHCLIDVYFMYLLK